MSPYVGPSVRSGSSRSFSSGLTYWPFRLFNSSRSHRDVLPAAVASLPLTNTLCRDVSETPPASRRCSPRDETLSTAFPIFHAAAGRSEEDRYQSLTVHYNSSCQIERASVGCPPMDSTFLQRSMLICSLLLLFVPASIDASEERVVEADRVETDDAMSYRENLPDPGHCAVIKLQSVSS
jgi:hypothetical protein